MQLDLERGRIEPGFSGSAAWAEPRARSASEATAAPAADAAAGADSITEEAAVGLLVAVGAPDADGLQSAMLIPTATLFAAWPEMDRHWRPRNPYKGLRAFTALDRADFFGRGALTADLARRVTDPETRLTLLLGPSGSGKSSVLGAGLMPALTESAPNGLVADLEPGPWRVLTTRPGGDPFHELADRLLAAQEADRRARGEPAFTDDQRTAEYRSLKDLLTQPPEGPADLFHQVLARRPEGTRLLLVVDQFEELFTNVAAAPARDFCRLLAALRDADLPLHLLLAMRADFLGAALEGPARPFVTPDLQVQMAPLDGADLRAAVEAPAAGGGVRFAGGVVDGMLTELADQPGRLPLLQFALEALWSHQHGRSIDERALAAIGGVRRALARYADGVIDDLSETDRGRARRILVQLVRPPEQADADGVRRVASLRNIAAGDLGLLPRLAQCRLVVTSASGGPAAEGHGAPDVRAGEAGAGDGDNDRNGGGVGDARTNAESSAAPPAGLAEIAHEALIREWPRLRTWVAEDRGFLLWQEGLRTRMADWHKHAQGSGYLLGGPTLAEAEGQLSARRAELADADIAYIEASRRRARRNRRLTVAGVAAVMLSLAALAGVALLQRQAALAQEQAALAAAERATRARAEAETLVNYITFELRDKLEPLGRLDLLTDTYRRVHDYYERLGISGQGVDIIRRRAVNYSDQADALLARGDLEGAEDNYAEASMLLAELADAEPDNPDRQRDLSVSLEKLGNIKAAQGDLSGAQSAYEQDLEIAERLASSDPSNAGWQRDLSVSLNKVGDIKAAQGDLSGALSAYEQGLVIREGLASSDPSNAEWQRDLAYSHWKLAEVSDGAAETEHLRAALAVVEAMAAAGILAPTDADWPEMIRDRLRESEASSTP